MSCRINPNFLPHKTSAFLFSLTITRATFTIFRVSIIVISICDTPDPWSSLMISSALWLVKVAPAFTPGREQTLTQLWGFARVGPSLLCNTLSCFLSLTRPSFFHLIHPACSGPIYSFCFLRTHFSWKPSLIAACPHPSPYLPGQDWPVLGVQNVDLTSERLSVLRSQLLWSLLGEWPKAVTKSRGGRLKSEQGSGQMESSEPDPDPCMFLRKELNLSGPQCCHLSNGIVTRNELLHVSTLKCSWSIVTG